MSNHSGGLAVLVSLACLSGNGYCQTQVKSTYAFTLSTYGRARVVELKQPPSEYRSALAGDLILSGQMGGSSLYGRIVVRSLALVNGSARLPTEENALRAALGKPFVVFRRNGKVTGCAFPPDVPPEGRKLVRTVLSIAQLSAAGKAAGNRLILDDTIGTKLLLTRVSGESQILTEKKYVANTANALNLSLTGEWKVKRSSRNLLDLEELHGQETLQALVTKLSSSTTRIQAEIRHRNTSRASNVGLVSTAGQPERLWARPSESQVRQSLARHTLHGLDSAAVFRLVEQLGTKEQSDQSGTDAFSKLRALVIVSDDAAKEVGQRLRIAPVGTPQFVAYGQALISAGSPSAQTAFLDALRARKGEAAASMKLVAELVGLDHPTASTIHSLREFAADRSHSVVASSSVLILGRFAERIKSASLIRELGADLLSTADPGRQRLYIGALGNAGQASCLPYLQRFLGSSDVKVRADATAALRFIPSGKVDGMLCNRLMRDRSDEVREAAVFALGFRPHNDRNFGSLILSLREDPSEGVRRSALNTLWAQRENQPAIVMIVSEISKKDPSKDIRKTATDLLNIDRAKG